MSVDFALSMWSLCTLPECSMAESLCVRNAFVRNRLHFVLYGIGHNFLISQFSLSSWRLIVKNPTSELYGMSLAESQKFVGKIEMH